MQVCDRHLHFSLVLASHFVILCTLPRRRKCRFYDRLYTVRRIFLTAFLSRTALIQVHKSVFSDQSMTRLELSRLELG
jgi:hypothetical protein